MSNAVTKDVSGAHQRKYTRHEVRATARLESLDENLQLGEPLHVMLLNIGRVGVMFESPVVLDVGTTWRLRVVQQGHLVTSVPLVVRYTKSTGCGYRIGGQFIIEPIVLHTLGVDPLIDGLDGMTDVETDVFESPDAARS